MGPGGAALDIVASDSERAALAKRFGFLGLPALSARVTVDRRLGGQIVVEGRLRGRIVQACVLTLDPVNQDLDDTFRIVFKKDLSDDRDPENGEAVLSAQADAPEPLSGNLLDVGEIVAEQLSLAADPYPRRPGARLEDVMPKPRHPGRRGPPDQRRHPFAGLAALRDKPGRGR
ncbi:YceD family protein [Reyranella sp.]|uniref:YceD family protein n=1 Tax=Reyranella sp. TaxID=1929291 RepID=UPI003782DB4C